MLSGVLKCNPYSVRDTAIIIERGYNMTPKVQEKKMRPMISYVKKHSTQDWANQYIKDIKAAHNQVESSLFLGLTPDVIKYRLMNQK